MNYVGDNQLDRGGDMSTPDARLNAAERAALAGLEAAATAADPSLAARLRGGRAWRARPVVHFVASRVRPLWSVLLGLRWWGIPLTVLGLLLMALGLGTSMALSFAGAVISAVGLRVSAEILLSRLKPPG